MKSFITILALVAVAAADVSHIVRNPEADAKITDQTSDVSPNQFNYGFKTSNGIQAEQSGVLTDVGKEDEAISVQGSNTYTGPDGIVYETIYIADKNGYQAQGAHLPTTPPPQPIPDYILRSIEYNAAHPAKPDSKY